MRDDREGTGPRHDPTPRTIASAAARETRARAVAEFRRAMRWITLCGILLVAAVLTFLGMTGELYLHEVIATVAGVFVSVLLGCGLFALAFFSDKSGHDQEAADATHLTDPDRR